MKHVLSRDTAFITKIADFDGHSFHFLRENIFAHKACIAMPLYLQLKLVEVDTLEVEIVLNMKYAQLLRPQLHLVILFVDSQVLHSQIL